MPKHKIAIFVHGCFWHAHAGCRRASIPESNQSYWKVKLEHNAERDVQVRDELTAAGWRVLWIWECALNNIEKREKLIFQIKEWINSSDTFRELPAHPTR